MRFEPTRVAGAMILDLEPREDPRGYFARAFCVAELAAHGLEPGIEQVNMSLTRVAGTIRGFHWQVAPHAEAKTVRCIAGAVYDVCVDLRPDSPTRGAWVGVELSAANRRALHIPAGAAHGYQALTDDAELMYSSSASYAPDAERGARWNDPTFGVEWPIGDPSVSDKDAAWPDFRWDDA